MKYGIALFETLTDLKSIHPLGFTKYEIVVNSLCSSRPFLSIGLIKVDPRNIDCNLLKASRSAGHPSSKLIVLTCDEIIQF